MLLHRWREAEALGCALMGACKAPQSDEARPLGRAVLRRDGGASKRCLTLELRRDRQRKTRPAGRIMHQGAPRAWSSAVGPRLQRRVRPRCLRAKDHGCGEAGYKEVAERLPRRGERTSRSTLRALRLRAVIEDALHAASATCVAHLTARRSTAARSAIHVFGLGCGTASRGTRRRASPAHAPLLVRPGVPVRRCSRR
jgi:hypothetical protein